jgi:hypothetical protein
MFDNVKQAALRFLCILLVITENLAKECTMRKKARDGYARGPMHFEWCALGGRLRRLGCLLWCWHN